GAACRPWWHSASRLARRLWQAYRRRNREVGQGDPGGQHQGGVIGATSVKYSVTPVPRNRGRRLSSRDVWEPGFRAPPRRERALADTTEDRQRDRAEGAKAACEGVGILKVARSLGIGTGTVQRISNGLR